MLSVKPERVFKWAVAGKIPVVWTGYTTPDVSIPRVDWRVIGRNSGWFTEKLRAALWERQSGICFYCRTPQATIAAIFGNSWMEHNQWALQVEHVIAKSKGGSNDAENLVLACPFCNRAKNDLTVEAFLKWLDCVRDHTQNSHMDRNALSNKKPQTAVNQ